MVSLYKMLIPLYIIPEIIAFGVCCVITFFLSSYILSKTGFHRNLVAALVIIFVIVITILFAFAIIAFYAFHVKYHDMLSNVILFGIWKG